MTRATFPERECLLGILRALSACPAEDDAYWLNAHADSIFQAARGGYGVPPRDDPLLINRRKPRVFWLTITLMAAYTDLTRRRVTRISRKVKLSADKDYRREDGDFAAFADEVFGMFGVKAKAAGQVRLLKNHFRRARERIGD